MAITKKEDILKALQAIRPGREVKICTAGSNELVVLVKDVTFEHLEMFIEEIGQVIPQIIDLVSDVLVKNTAREKLLGGDSADLADEITNIAGSGAVLSRLLPIVSRRLLKLIRLCVEPDVLDDLPAEFAAPIIEAWIDLNILDPGKVKVWVQAYQGVMTRVQESPILGSSSQNSSPVDSH